MVASAQSLSSRRYDVCIVGTGPAGIPLALELERLKPDWHILVLEFGIGGEATNELDDTIQIETPLNHHSPYECTNKGLGGSSATWGGRCVTYDDIDFMQRDVIGDHCTWDLGIFEDAKRFYDRASVYLECGEPVFSTHEIPAISKGRISEHFIEGDITDCMLERWSRPTRLGPAYRDAILASSSIELAEGFRADKILCEGAKVIGLEATNRQTKTTVTVLADKFVVAAGAQESTRLLLKSPEVFKERGGVPDSLGAYYQGHVSGKICSVRFKGDPKKTDFGFLKDGEIYVRRRFQLPTSILLRENLLNTVLWLDNPPYYDASHRNGTMSFIYLMMITPVLSKKLAPPAIANSVTHGSVTGVGKHIGNVLRGLPKSVIEPFQIFVKRYFAKRKLPGVFLYNSKNEYALHFHAEQVPAEENRMELLADGSTLSIRYGYLPADVDSVIRTHALLDQWLRQTGAGELVYWYPKEELGEKIVAGSKDGVHQVGTTRMSLKSDDGVVDPDLLVWGTSNLYVCSSSVFPTSGQANPTFLLTAFAARLAQHLVHQIPG